MRNIFIGLLICVFGGASFLTNVQSTTFPGSYLTGNSDVEYQKFSDIDNGVLVNYRFVPLNSVASSRVKRQVVSTEQKNAENVKSPSSPVKKQTSTDPAKPGITLSISKNDGSTSLNSTATSSATNSSTNSISNGTSSSAGSITSGNGTSSTSGSLNTNSSTSAVPSNSTIIHDEDQDYLEPWPLFNKTITAPNATEYQFNVSESHKYYESVVISDGAKYWMDLSQNNLVEQHDLLSRSHRRAATIMLKFKFPFYGHLIENVTVATGGFMYLGEHVHAWLAATQYVAPLMANFDSSLSANASVRFLSTENNFTVEWSQVHLQDSPEKGPFTFLASLKDDGTIVFAYKTLPVGITQILDHAHPVKVGLSDAYIRDRNVLFVKQKTIYEYDRVDLLIQKTPIGNGSAIVFTPKNTCLSYLSCKDCANHDTDFDCTWCPSVARCSDGYDRYRHSWLNKGCDVKNLTSVGECETDINTYTVNNGSSSSPNSDNHTRIDNNSNRDHGDQAAATKQQQHHDGNNGMGATGVIGVLILVMLIVTAVGWVFYAYIFPHSSSGQLLIRYRPSQWTFNRRGHARYVAASVHMLVMMMM